MGDRGLEKGNNSERYLGDQTNRTGYGYRDKEGEEDGSTVLACNN